jgi:hypothetical protein
VLVVEQFEILHKLGSQLGVAVTNDPQLTDVHAGPAHQAVVRGAGNGEFMVFHVVGAGGESEARKATNSFTVYKKIYNVVLKTVAQGRKSGGFRQNTFFSVVPAARLLLHLFALRLIFHFKKPNVLNQCSVSALSSRFFYFSLFQVKISSPADTTL